MKRALDNHRAAVRRADRARRLALFLSFLFFLVVPTRPAFADKAPKAGPGGGHGAASHKNDDHGGHKADKAEKADDHAGDHADKAEGEPKPDAKPEEPKGPTNVKVNIVLAKLNKFELGPGSYSAEFYIHMKCDHEPCKPEPDVGNGKITGKEKMRDEKLEKEFKIKAELEAFVDLSEFPFDSHALYIGLADKNIETYHYEFDTALGAKVDDNVKLAGWQISAMAAGVEKVSFDGRELNELRFAVEITRPKIASFFKSLVPVFFMVFVAGFTLLLKPKSAAGRLSAATGGLMSVVMFHLSATSSLPPLGYLTRLDKFMIATYLVYIANIAFSVAMVRFEEKKNEKMSELAYLVAGGAVPGIALLAWLAVFLRIA